MLMRLVGWLSGAWWNEGLGLFLGVCSMGGDLGFFGGGGEAGKGDGKGGGKGDAMNRH